MTMMRRSFLLLLGICLIAIYFQLSKNKSGDSFRERSGTAPSRGSDSTGFTSGEGRSDVRSQGEGARPKFDLTSPDSPAVIAATSKLKELEAKRLTFCRKTENDSRVLYNFVIARPSEVEAEEMKKLIFEVKGITRDDNGRVVTWQERLGNDYLLSPDFENFIVSIEYSKQTGMGHYDVLGVAPGKLLMREGGAPISADGAINSVASDVAFSFESDWRFVQLFEKERE